MECRDCGFQYSAALSSCPRCEFRRAAPSAPPVLKAAAPPQEERLEPSPVALAEPPAEAVPPPPAVAPAGRGRVWGAALVIAILVLGATAWQYRSKTDRRGGEWAQRASALFAAGHPVCRQGAFAPCQNAVAALRGIGDRSDASLLIADFQIQGYLAQQPNGETLNARWRQDSLSETELQAMGAEAYRQNRHVYRSLWLWAMVKREKMPVPQLQRSGH